MNKNTNDINTYLHSIQSDLFETNKYSSTFVGEAIKSAKYWNAGG